MMELSFLALDIFLSAVLLILMVFFLPKLAGNLGFKIIFLKIEKKTKEEILLSIKEEIELLSAKQIFIKHKKFYNEIAKEKKDVKK